MTHEKIIKRPDGSRIKIEVYFTLVGYIPNKTSKYTYTVHVCEVGKRKFTHKVGDGEGIVTPEEIQEAKMELYKKLKP